MTKTEAKRLIKELRAEAQAFANALDDPDYSTDWMSDRLYNVDGISALLREGIVGGEF